MRTIISISIATVSLALALSCGDDGASKRPEDGTVKAWESCRWDGQIEPLLCESELGCTDHGICAPGCMTIADCPTFDGFDVDCKVSGGAQVCVPRCNTDKQCPNTGGAELTCFAGSLDCIGKS